MRALVVGAGSVGQVYGHHLKAGGAEVALLVKPRHLEAARAGFELYPLNRAPRRQAPVRFQAQVFSSLDEAAAFRPDVVVLCVPSTGLREGDWLAKLARGIEQATVVVLQPAPNDLAYVRRRVPAERVVLGMIGIIAYAAPLPGERVPGPGTAYWFPPMSPSAFSGEPARTRRVVEAFRRGGLPATKRRSVLEAQTFGAAMIQALVLALQAAGWSLSGLRADRSLLALAHSAALATVKANARRLGVRAPVPLRLATPLVLRWALRFAPGLVPFDLEAYLRAHFTKVSPQTELWLQESLALVAEQGGSTEPLQALAERARVSGTPGA